MLKIRLQKIGKKNAPSYRVVLVEHTTSPQGKYIELLGTYNPRTKKKNFNKEKIGYWLSKGAQASPTVHNLLVDEKIIDREKLMAWKPKKKLSEAKSAVEAEKAKTPKAPKKAASEGGEPRPENSGREEVKAEEPKTEQPPPEPIKTEEPKIEEPKPVEEPKPAEEPKSEVPIDTETKKE